MSEFRGIPVITTGTKYQTEQGFAAIKNGVKARADRLFAWHGLYCRVTGTGAAVAARSWPSHVVAPCSSR